MTIDSIVKILIASVESGNVEFPREQKRKIVSKWHETYISEKALDDAFEDCRQLAHQRDGLKEALPVNAELYDSQFSDGVRKAAEHVQAAIEITP